MTRSFEVETTERMHKFPRAVSYELDRNGVGPSFLIVIGKNDKIIREFNSEFVVNFGWI